MNDSIRGFAAVWLTLGLLLMAPFPASPADIVTAVPGNTVVQDPAGDLLLVNCDTSSPNRPCSLPPTAPLALPPWADLKTAKITQIGSGQVDLFIALYEAIPAVPPVPFLAYIWQFQDGCVEPSPTDKDGINVVWDGNTATWSANWFVIENCDPRTIVQGDPIDDVRFTDDGVLVRVSLDDLVTKGGAPLLWYAAVRRLPFKHPTFTRTVPVDVAPDVIEFNPAPPPILINPEPPAPWEPR